MHSLTQTHIYKFTQMHSHALAQAHILVIMQLHSHTSSDKHILTIKYLQDPRIAQVLYTHLYKYLTQTNICTTALTLAQLHTCSSKHQSNYTPQACTTTSLHNYTLTQPHICIATHIFNLRPAQPHTLILQSYSLVRTVSSACSYLPEWIYLLLLRVHTYPHHICQAHTHLHLHMDPTHTRYYPLLILSSTLLFSFNYLTPFLQLSYLHIIFIRCLIATLPAIIFVFCTLANGSPLPVRANSTLRLIFLPAVRSDFLPTCLTCCLR